MFSRPWASPVSGECLVTHELRLDTGSPEGVAEPHAAAAARTEQV